MSTPKIERVPTEAPIETMWARLGVLESVGGARRFLAKRADELDASADAAGLDAKADGLAFTIRSAREFFQAPIAGNLTAACVAYYYGALSLLQALLLSDPRNDLSLERLEEFTRYGHGLRTFSAMDEAFPGSEKLIVLSNGFLPRFLSTAGYDLDLTAMVVSRGYDAMDDVPAEERKRVTALSAVLGRVPELKSIYVELYGRSPDYLTLDRVGAADNARLHFPRHKNAEPLTQADIRELLELSDEVELEEDETDIHTGFHPLDVLLGAKRTHSTVLADTAYVRPLLGTNDVLIFEFMLLYVFSIWVRYRPALWREVSEGEHSEFRAMVETLLAVVARTFPNEVMDRVYGRKFLFAGFSYYT